MVDLPKVGKSSLINSLKRYRACTTSLTPGAMQGVQVDSKVKLHDCRGMRMVLASGNMTDSSVALRNAIKIENLATAGYVERFYSITCALVEAYFAPTSQSLMSKNFRDSESLGKSNMKKWSQN